MKPRQPAAFTLDAAGIQSSTFRQTSHDLLRFASSRHHAFDGRGQAPHPVRRCGQALSADACRDAKPDEPVIAPGPVYSQAEAGQLGIPDADSDA